MHTRAEQQHAFSQNALYLRFRDVPDFFLAIEIDEQDFTPKFYLLVTKYAQRARSGCVVRGVISANVLVDSVR
jgi:hypothetical protein